jgi:enoyl-CoA hydratase/carnithine racemase
VSTSQYEQIDYSVLDPVATITLNRPESLNAWTPIMGAELDHALYEASMDQSVVGVVITGAGRGFCSGADFGVLAQPVGTPPSPRAGETSWGDDFRGRFTTIMSIPKPVIAAINGPVAGMALGLILACDLRFMSEDASIQTSFARLGLVAEFGTSWLLPRLIGSGRAMDLLISGRQIRGPEAFALGLVNEVVAGDSLLDTARNYVLELAQHCSPSSMAIIKRQLNQQLHRGLGSAELESRELMSARDELPDVNEGLAAIAERRAPRFRRIPLKSISDGT